MTRPAAPVARPMLGRTTTVIGAGTGLVSTALGVGLVLEAESAFGRAWSAFFVVVGVLCLVWATVLGAWTRVGHDRARAASRAGVLLLGVWAVVTALIGMAEETWLWGVVQGLPGIYLVVFALRSTPARAASRRP